MHINSYLHLLDRDESYMRGNEDLPPGLLRGKQTDRLSLVVDVAVVDSASFLVATCSFQSLIQQSAYIQADGRITHPNHSFNRGMPSGA